MVCYYGIMRHPWGERANSGGLIGSILGNNARVMENIDAGQCLVPWVL